MGYHTDQSAYEPSADALWTQTDDLRTTRGRTFLPCNEWFAPPGVDDDVYTPRTKSSCRTEEKRCAVTVRFC